MNGLIIRTSEEYIEKVSKKSTELRLLTRFDGTEVMHQHIEMGTPFRLVPSNHSSTLEFFYVLSGKLMCDPDGEKHELGRGDYFYAKSLDGVVFFRTLTDVDILYISTVPVFTTASSAIKELSEISIQVESKDAFTRGHSERVRELTERIATRLGLSGQRLETLLWGALFHDVGKISISSDILNKPSRLTNEEFEKIKYHPRESGRLVRNTFLQGIEDIVIQHHERLDGSGYPQGLKGNEICLEARIVAIADTYDAMTSDRPYRQRLDHDIAMAELRRFAGTHFDESIVEVLNEVEQPSSTYARTGVYIDEGPISSPEHQQLPTGDTLFIADK